jgi:DNA adenine methylase
MKLTAIAPWFGGKRTLAPEIVRQLGKHSYYFEACAGSMAVLFAKPPSGHETVCDLHGALTNLAWVVQDEVSAVRLFNQLQRVSYSDELYRESKQWLERHEETIQRVPVATPCFDLAYHYFIASWMGRNGVAGTQQINYQIATRWTQGGGSGPLRFRNAVDSIPAWCERLRNVCILRRDLFAVLPKIEDAEGVSIYADPPYFRETRSGKTHKDRGTYLHEFTAEQHEQLAAELRRFKKARVVVSYYASPRLAKLYPGWTVIDCSRQKHLHVQNARGTGRKEAPEVLLVNGEPYGSAAVVEKVDAHALFTED